MGGLIFFFIMGVWFFLVLKLGIFVAEILPKRWWNIPISILIFSCVLILPIVDELVGGWQFKQLCKEHSSVQVDRQTAKGKTVYLEIQPRIKVKNKLLPIFIEPWHIIDLNNSEVVLNYNRLSAKGGVLFKGLSQVGAPFFFKGVCTPKNISVSKEAFEEYGINYVEPPVRAMEK